MPTSASCRDCGTTWTGHKPEHCTQCHRTFTGTSAGDKHRTGDHQVKTGPVRRRCLTDDEMAGSGLALNAKGLWGWPGPDRKWWEDEASPDS